MPTYIHVVSDTKTPENRGSSNSPFETHSSDPNDGTMFGPTQRTMFVEVVEDAEPSYNIVTEQLVPLSTLSVESVPVDGAYNSTDGFWHLGFTVTANTVEEARGIKLGILADDFNAAIDVGYPVPDGEGGQFIFPFTEDFFNLLGNRQRWLTDSINSGELPTDSQITFADRNGREVSLGQSALSTHHVSYGSDYLRLFEKEVDARDEITDALTAAAVDAVTWDFSAS